MNGFFERQTWFQIQISDTFGNDLLIGGHSVIADLVPLEDGKLPLMPRVVDNNNGSFTITYTPGENQNGPYTFTILMNNENIKDSPFEVWLTDNTTFNAVLLGVCLGVVFLSAFILIGLLGYRRYQRRKQYAQL